MSIKFSCPECGKALSAPDGSEGKRGKCKGCGTSIVISAVLLATKTGEEKTATRMQVECPLCYYVTNLDVAYKGSRVICAKCYRVFYIPENDDSETITGSIVVDECGMTQEIKPLKDPHGGLLNWLQQFSVSLELWKVVRQGLFCVYCLTYIIVGVCMAYFLLTDTKQFGEQITLMAASPGVSVWFAVYGIYLFVKSDSRDIDGFGYQMEDFENIVIGCGIFVGILTFVVILIMAHTPDVLYRICLAFGIALGLGVWSMIVAAITSFVTYFLTFCLFELRILKPICVLP